MAAHAFRDRGHQSLELLFLDLLEHLDAPIHVSAELPNFDEQHGHSALYQLSLRSHLRKRFFICLDLSEIVTALACITMRIACNTRKMQNLTGFIGTLHSTVIFKCRLHISI
jgi:hypothetical protein